MAAEEEEEGKQDEEEEEEGQRAAHVPSRPSLPPLGRWEDNHLRLQNKRVNQRNAGALLWAGTGNKTSSKQKEKKRNADLTWNSLTKFPAELAWLAADVAKLAS